MTIGEFCRERIKLFFFLSVMILVAQSVVGTILEPDRVLELHYVDLLNPLYLAGLCTLPTLVTFSRKKLSVRQVLLRRVLQFVLIEGIVMLISFSSPSIDTSRPEVILLMGGSVLVIYALAMLVTWLGQLEASRKMTGQLRRLQDQAREDAAAEQDGSGHRRQR